MRYRPRTPCATFDVKIIIVVYAFVLFHSSLRCLSDHPTSEDKTALLHRSTDRRMVVIGESLRPGAGIDPVADGAYQPQTRNLLDCQNIGLDQQEMVEHLQSLAMESALAMYQEGGHSASVATLFLSAPFPTSIKDRSIVLGVSETGEQVRGDVLMGSPAQSTTVGVTYSVSTDGPHCYVGGKSNPVTEGCYASSQSIFVAGQEVEGLTYDAIHNTKNLRTLQMLAVDADGIYKDCETCPLPTYLKYVSYYGDFSYADHIIRASFQQSATSLKASNVDFGASSPEGRGEVIRRVSLNLVIWMAVVGMLESSVETCRKEDPTNNGIAQWDAAVGYYIGTGTSSSALLFDLADQLCFEFNTCDETGLSAVNREAMERFGSGQTQISQGLCEEAEKTKNGIVSLMTVPLIQGALKYSFALQWVEDDVVLGAAYSFVAAILPLLNDCNSDGLGVIFSSVQIPLSEAAAATDFFPLVKGFIEEQYDCIGVSCEDVGDLAGADLCEGGVDDDTLVGNDNIDSSSSKLEASYLEPMMLLALSLMGF